MQTVVADQRNYFGIKENWDLLSFNSVEHLFGKLSSARFELAVNHVTAVQPREYFHNDGFEFDAAFICQPLNSASGHFAVLTG